MGGICGVVSKNSCIDDLLTATFSLQHRGETYCGLSTSNDKEIRKCTHEGKVLESFKDEELKKLIGNYGIGSTHPIVRQPMALDSRVGKFSIVFSGKIFNKRNLANKLKKEGHTLSLKHTDIEIVAKLIAEGENVVNGLEKIANQIKGAYCIGILTLDGLYAFKSPVGVEPLIFGHNNYLGAFSSESCALKEIGLRREECRDVNPGEIIFLDNGIETLKQLNGKRKTCAFEWGYWARIDSIIEDISVKGMRERCGIILAKDDKKRGFEPEMIMPIRDSGVGYAIGYHHGSEVPYDEGLFKNLYLARSYIQPTQLARTEVAERKQSIIRGAIDGKIIVVVDDSIRRGTTIKELIHSLKNAGAKEVHLRIGSPENKYPCKYSVFPKKKGELLAERSKEEQRKFIGADSLEYISLDDYVRAIGIPEEQLCLECWEQNC